MSAKQQFNVTLPAELVRRLKHHSIDVQLSLSDLVARVLEEHLEGRTDRLATPQDAEVGPALRLQPMVHVKDMPASVSFYERLGGTVLHGSRDGDWVLMDIGGAQIGLLAHPPNPQQNEGEVELNFQCTVGLDRLEKTLRQAGGSIVRPTTDEGFGRQLQLSAPGGPLVKINELDPGRYA